MLKIVGLSKKFGQKVAVDNLSLEVLPGQICAFIGHNGAGKTTLIRIICGLQEPTNGNYTIYGTNNCSGNIASVRKRMGAIVESPSIYGEMSAKDNLIEQFKLVGMPSLDGIDELLKLVGLENTGKKKAKNFSLGMKQRLGIAISLASNPDFLILDEPINRT